MARILIVDDEVVIRDLLEAHLCLGSGHACDQAASAKEAMGLVTAALADGADGYDLIISDIRMPKMDGLAFLRAIRSQVESLTPCIVLTASGELDTAIQAVQLQAFDFIRKPWEVHELRRAVERALERRQDLLLRRKHQADLERRIADARAAQEASDRAAIAAFSALMQKKDPQTADHCERVRRLAALLGREMGFEGDSLRALEFGAMLHDIGKVDIPAAILGKAGPLSPEEWAVMRTNPVLGAQTVESIPYFHGASEVVRCHHERWDGTGYPAGMRGIEIPLAARIVAVVNAYDAITSKRSYAEAETPEAALREIRRCAGTQFDPTIVEVFERLGLASIEPARSTGEPSAPAPVRRPSDLPPGRATAPSVPPPVPRRPDG